MYLRTSCESGPALHADRSPETTPVTDVSLSWLSLNPTAIDRIQRAVQSNSACAQNPSVRPAAAPTMVNNAMLSPVSPSVPNASPQTPKMQSSRLDRGFADSGPCGRGGGGTTRSGAAARQGPETDARRELEGGVRGLCQAGA